jgi:hypothetical protein
MFSEPAPTSVLQGWESCPHTPKMMASLAWSTALGKTESTQDHCLGWGQAKKPDLLFSSWGPIHLPPPLRCPSLTYQTQLGLKIPPAWWPSARCPCKSQLPGPLSKKTTCLGSCGRWHVCLLPFLTHTPLPLLRTSPVSPLTWHSIAMVCIPSFHFSQKHFHGLGERRTFFSTWMARIWFDTFKLGGQRRWLLGGKRDHLPNEDREEQTAGCQGPGDITKLATFVSTLLFFKWLLVLKNMGLQEWGQWLKW